MPQFIPNNIILISKVAARDQSAEINSAKIYSISRSTFIIDRDYIRWFAFLT